MGLPVLDLCAEEDASNANSHIAEFNEIQWEREWELEADTDKNSLSEW